MKHYLLSFAALVLIFIVYCVALNAILGGPPVIDPPVVRVHLTGDVWDMAEAEVRARILAKVLARAQPGTQIELGPGQVEFGPDRCPLPPGVTIRGAGIHTTVLQSAALWTPAEGSCFEASAGTVVEDLCLSCAAPINEQAVCTGFSGGKPPENAKAIYRRVKMIARTQTLYAWVSPMGLEIVAEDCEIWGGKWLVTAGSSNAPKQDGTLPQTIRLVGCNLHGDSNLSRYGGDSGPRCLGMICRGGKLSAIDCTIDLKGAHGIETRGLIVETSPYASAESINCRYTLAAADAVDVEARSGSITVKGGSGSLADGKLNTKGSVTTKP